MTDFETRARLIAFHLPQFHPILENDEWWGKDFTEWTNVTKGRPLFPGHYQPHVSADLGIYDLRLPQVRQAQADLARAYGVEGFCYWHYWFHGKRLLEKPVNAILSSGQPDFPFCLAWANESWSRRWLGEPKEIIQKQTYSVQDDLEHVRWLITAFSDSRYIRIQERPLFLIYRPHDLPDAQRTLDIFRTECRKEGLPDPFFVGINAHNPSVDCKKLGFDGTLNHEPQLGVLRDYLDDRLKISKFFRNLRFGVNSAKLKIYDYETSRKKMSRLTQAKVKYPFYPCIFVSWDNTARRDDNAIIIVNSTPEKFESGLLDIIQSVMDKPHDDRLVFINAWNEWGEGMHLEPDLKHGRQYLESVKRANVIL